jgi:hypothetical protein
MSKSLRTQDVPLIEGPNKAIVFTYTLSNGRERTIRMFGDVHSAMTTKGSCKTLFPLEAESLEFTVYLKRELAKVAPGSFIDVFFEQGFVTAKTERTGPHWKASHGSIYKFEKFFYDCLTGRTSETCTNARFHYFDIRFVNGSNAMPIFGHIGGYSTSHANPVDLDIDLGVDAFLSLPVGFWSGPYFDYIFGVSTTRTEVENILQSVFVYHPRSVREVLAYADFTRDKLVKQLKSIEDGRRRSEILWFFKKRSQTIESSYDKVVNQLRDFAETVIFAKIHKKMEKGRSKKETHKFQRFPYSSLYRNEDLKKPKTLSPDKTGYDFLTGKDTKILNYLYNEIGEATLIMFDIAADAYVITRMFRNDLELHSSEAWVYAGSAHTEIYADLLTFLKCELKEISYPVRTERDSVKCVKLVRFDTLTKEEREIVMEEWAPEGGSFKD